jgi:phosphopantetheinyl transferase (holo-ACP synthase)
VAREVRLFLESVAVEAVAADRERIAAADFTPAELEAIAGRRVQTLAGLLALKRALVALYRAAAPARPCRPVDFVLAHRESGAPYVALAPPLPAGGPPAVSISHTRGWAYGLAVLPEAERA